MVYTHPLTDGRDVSPKSGLNFIKSLQNKFTIATISGRFYAMDRDKRWDRVKQAYDVIAKNQNIQSIKPDEYIQNSYNNDIFDEFIEPASFVDFGGIKADDGVIFINFRNDRAREICAALAVSEFNEFKRENICENLITMTNYADKFNIDANEVSKKITKLQSIKNIMIGRIELGSMLDIETVTEIFVRINSAGVVLSQADFAMSKISVNEKYEGNDIRKTIDYFCHFAKTPADFDNIKNNDIAFSAKDIFNKITWIKDKNEDLYLPSYVDVLRVAFTYKFKRGKLQDLVSLLSGRDFETREYREDIVEDSYNKLYEGVKSFVSQTNFERYVMILKSAGIIDDSLVRSQNVLNFGYILFLLLKERNINPDIIEKLVKRWVIMSIITQRYTSSPESQFDLDIRRLNEAENLVQYINDELERRLGDAFWDSILVENFNTPVASSPYWKTYLIAQIALNDSAFLSKDMKVRTLVEGRGDVHHIFPKDYLQKNGKNNKSIYNQIANFALIQTEINLQITNKAPNAYMLEINEQCENGNATIGSIVEKDLLKENLRINCIPEEFENMTVSDFDEFLKERRKLMAKKVKEYYYSL